MDLGRVVVTRVAVGVTNASLDTAGIARAACTRALRTEAGGAFWRAAAAGARIDERMRDDAEETRRRRSARAAC